MTLFSILSYIDLFQKSPCLKINGKPRNSLMLGRFFSALILSFVFYNAFQSDMVNKNNPIVLQQSLQLTKRPKINLKDEKFSLAFGVVDDYSNFPIDPSIFSLTVIDIRLMNSEVMEENEVAFEKCEEAHFVEFKESYQSLGLFNMSCLPKDNNLTLKGYWDEDEIQYLSISMSICKNNTSNSICQSQENIDEFFHHKYFEIYLIQNNFDMKNYENPLSSKISAYYVGIELGRRTQISNFVKKSKILSSKNIIFSNFDETNTYVYEQGETIFQNSDDQLLSFEFYSSDNLLIYQRSYQKLYDLMASLGGIISPLMILCSLIVGFFNDWYINDLILTRLYNVNGLNNLKKKRTIPNMKSKVQIKKKKLFTQRKEKDFLNFSIWERVKFIMKPNIFFNQKEKKYQSLLKKADNKLDLFEILLKLEQISKMKYILFNDDQRKIFDFFSKKCVSLSSTKVNKNQYTFDLAQPRQDEIKKYISNITEKRKESKIDKKLMEMIKLK